MKSRLLHVDDEFLSYDKDCQAILYFRIPDAGYTICFSGLKKLLRLALN